MLDYRNAEHKDIRVVIDLEIECMREGRDARGSECPAFDERINDEGNLVAIVESRCGCAFVAEDSDGRGRAEIVGAIIALDAENRPPEEQELGRLIVLGVFVAPGFRGMGIGTTLLGMVEEWAIVNRYRKLLSGIYTPNEWASRMFKTREYRVYYEAMEKEIGT